MPPDMTAGLMPLIGTPPCVPVSGKPDTGPPGPEGIAAGSLSTSLFASLLAQITVPLETVPLKADTSQEKTPKTTDTAPKTPDALPVLSQLLGTAGEPTVKPAVGTKQSSDPKQTIVPKKLADAKQVIAGSLKTMDTVLSLSSLPTEKSKDKASELPLHKASADIPSVSSQSLAQTPAVPVSMPVAVNMVMPLLAPITMSVQVPAAVTVASAKPTIQPASALLSVNAEVSALPVTALPVTALPVTALPVTALPVTALPVNAAPTLREALDSSQVVGLALPRTFTLTGSVAAGSTAVPKTSSAVPTLTSEAALTVSVSAAPAIPTQFESVPIASNLADVLPKLASSQSLPTQPANIVLPHSDPANAAAPQTLSTVQAMPQALIIDASQALPAAPAIQIAAATLTASQSAPAVTVEEVSSSIQPVVSNAAPAGSVSTSAKVSGKSLENALKSPVENADINTRISAAALPSGTAKESVSSAVFEAVSSKSEKHGEAQADPITLGTTSLAGTQSVATSAPTEAKPLTAAEQAEVVQQTANGVAAMPLPTKPGGTEQISLQLHPKDWGQLQVSVSIVPGTEAGSAKTVTAHIVAETPQIKAALESQAGTLHQALTASGLHLEHLTVSVKAPEAKVSEVKPAAQSASAGQPSSQGQPNTNSQAGTSMGGGQPSANQTSSSTTASTGSGAFASFAGSSQDSRNGQQERGFSPAIEPEQEEMMPRYTPLRPALGRIDTHA